MRKLRVFGRLLYNAVKNVLVLCKVGDSLDLEGRTPLREIVLSIDVSGNELYLCVYVFTCVT